VESLAALVAFAFVSSVTPGPNNLLLWASGAQFGLRRAVPHVFGTAVGLGLMALAVAAGLGALITTIPALAFVLKVAGSAYLLYLAWQIARAGALRRADVARPFSLLQAAAFQAINVKAWIFALGAMTTFRPASLPAVQGGLLVALTMMAVIVPSAALWAAAGDMLGRLLSSPQARGVVNIVLASLLAATVVLVWV
jgi:threonine/homoserine/homoserine lactone efflux protein